MKNNENNKYIIETGIGLQDVDKLKNSSFFLSETNKYIKGEISLEELDGIITSYYSNKQEIEDRTEEADKIAIRIAKIINEDSFVFTVGQLLTIHKILFDGILDRAGQLRKYNFTKNEWVLNGRSVIYGDYRELESTLQYDFELEKKFSYKNLSIDEVIDHLGIFVSNLWQIHAFEEGNTRTIAVFFIKYLRSLGFKVTNDVFAKNSWYFRNSLVRANYNNIIECVFEDRSFINKFLRNLLLNEHNQLLNRTLHISAISSNTSLTKESRIINLLINDPKITTETIANELNISVRTVKNLIKVLVDEKKIKRINGKRFGYWKVL